MTLRDLFRWGNRFRTSQNGDSQQVLADQGYFLLGTRCRNKQDEVTVIEVLEKVLKQRVELAKLFATDSQYLTANLDPGRVVMTLDMRRMLVLCSEAWKCDEPVLFVSETGSGKTTAAHILSKLLRANGDVRLAGQHPPSLGRDLTVAGRSDRAFELHFLKRSEFNVSLRGARNLFMLFIDELNKTFEIVSTSCRFFACQNYQKHGGDRHALPKSFLNRFMSIAVNEMTDEDFVFVLEKALRGRFDKDTIHNMVEVNKRVAAIHIRKGGPFESSLRDLLRWSEAAARFDDLSLAYELTHVSRCRSKDERAKVREIHKTVLSEEAWCAPVPSTSLMTVFASVPYNYGCYPSDQPPRKLAACVSMNWLALLVGTLEELATAG